MSIEFKVVADELNILNNGKVTTIESIGGVFELEMSEHGFAITELDQISLVDFPVNLIVYDNYQSKQFDFFEAVAVSKQNNFLDIRCYIEEKYITWHKPYLASVLYQLLSDYFSSLGYVSESIDEEDGRVMLIVTGQIANGSIIDFIEKIAELVQAEYSRLDYQLTKDSSTNLIIKLFQFPPQYEVICSQYLLWFGELLKSLGIEAIVSTENKNGQTFLSIEPKDNTVLTSKIEKALYLYLSLPYSEYLPAESTSDNLIAKVEFQQLQHQIQMFQQQMEVKNSLLELKSATNEQLKKDLEAAKDKILLLESLKDNKLEFFEGAIALDEYKIGPVRISPKKVAKLFGKKTD